MQTNTSKKCANSQAASNTSNSQIDYEPKKSSISQMDSGFSSCILPTPVESSSVINNFLSKLPMWGGKVDLQSSSTYFADYSNFNLVNTCSIDYLLLCLWLYDELSSHKPNQLDKSDNEIHHLIKKVIFYLRNIVIYFN